MFTNNEHHDGLARGEHVAQNADSVQPVQRPASDAGVLEVAPGNLAPTLSHASENKPGMNNSNPAADTTSAAPNLNRKDKDMKANMPQHDKPVHHNGENHKDNHKHMHGKPHPHHEEETHDDSGVAAQNESDVASIADTEEPVSAGQILYSQL